MFPFLFLIFFFWLILIFSLQHRRRYAIQIFKEGSEFILEKGFDKTFEGIIIEKSTYTEAGFTTWILKIKLQNGEIVQVIAKAEGLGKEEISKITSLKIGKAISIKWNEGRKIFEIINKNVEVSP